MLIVRNAWELKKLIAPNAPAAVGCYAADAGEQAYLMISMARQAESVEETETMHVLSVTDSL